MTKVNKITSTISRDELLAMLVSYGIDRDEAEGWIGVSQDCCPKDDEEAERHWLRCVDWVRCATQEVRNSQFS